MMPVEFNSADDIKARKRPSYISVVGDIRYSQLRVYSYNRLKGPSKIWSNGIIEFTNTNGVSHRTDGPAIIFADGSRGYWVRGERYTADEFFLKYGVV